MSFAKAIVICTLIYDRKEPAGLAPLFDTATHLVTKNVHIATEDYNLNFIFKNPLDNDVCEGICANLAMVFLFLHLLQIEIYSRMELNQDRYLSWLMLTSLGAYEALFTKGKRRTARFAMNPTRSSSV